MNRIRENILNNIFEANKHAIDLNYFSVHNLIFMQKLFNEKSKQFDESFTYINDKNIDLITSKSTKSVH